MTCRPSIPVRWPSSSAPRSWRRSFSGDKKQLSSVLKAALSHRGTAMIDVLSTCVTFNDHEGSTKSYAYAKDHDDPLEEISFVPFFEDIEVEYEAGTTQEVVMHDGSKLYLKKLDADYNALDKMQAMPGAARDPGPRRVRHRCDLCGTRSGRLLDAAEPRGQTASEAFSGCGSTTEGRA